MESQLTIVLPSKTHITSLTLFVYTRHFELLTARTIIMPIRHLIYNIELLSLLRVYLYGSVIEIEHNKNRTRLPIAPL